MKNKQTNSILLAIKVCLLAAALAIPVGIVTAKAEGKVEPSKPMVLNNTNDNVLSKGVSTTSTDSNLIEGTWGTSPVTFDAKTGVLVVQSGTLNSYNVNSKTIDSSGLIKKSDVKKIIFNGTVYAPQDSIRLFNGMDFNNLIEIAGVLDTSNVTDMSYMFYFSSVITIDVSKWNTSNVKNMRYMFTSSKIKALNVSNWDTGKVTSMSTMFYKSSVENLDVTNWNTGNVTDMYSLFRDSLPTNLNVSNWDTSSATNMNSMFSNSKSTTLDVSKWNTGNVTDMSSLFQNTIATTLDISKWDTSKVTGMRSVFKNSLATILDISNWNTSNVTLMDSMFNNSRATTLDVSKWDTSKVIDMGALFRDSSATTLDVSNWNTSNVVSMISMFNNSSSTTLDVSKWNTSKVTNMDEMFSQSKIIKLDMSNWDMKRVTSFSDMLAKCLSLKELKLGKNSKVTINTALPDITKIGDYTGYWQNVGSGTVDAPKGTNVWSSQDLMANYSGLSDADTYVWQKSSILIGDINRDGEVDLDDLTALIDYLNTGALPTGVDEEYISRAGDLNLDDEVDLDDLTALVDILNN